MVVISFAVTVLLKSLSLIVSLLFVMLFIVIVVVVIIVIINKIVIIIIIIIAWTLRRIFSCLHSAIMGGWMCARNICSYYNIKNPVVVVVFAYCIAAAGIWFQTYFGVNVLPFPINVVVIPLVLLEKMLIWFVNYGSAIVVGV